MRRPLLASAIALVNAGAAFAQPAPVELGEIVVTASGFEQNISDAPASISVIPGEELARKNYTNITDAVKNIPGVFVNGGGNSQDISIRGMSENYTLYLVDGRPVSAGRNVNTNGLGGGKQIALPPASMIERVEVIRGPMSSLYGSDAMGGVINIITKKSTGEWSGSISSEYSKSFSDLNEDTRQSEVFVGGALVPGLIGLQLNGSWRDTEESQFISGDKNNESIPDSTRKQGSAKLLVTPDDQNEFELFYNSAEMDYRHNPGVSIEALDRRGNPAEAMQYSYHKDVYQLGHKGTFGNLAVDTYLQHDISERFQAPNDVERKEEVSTLNSQATYVLGNHIATFGGQYKDEELTNESNGLIEAGVPGAVKSMDRWIGALFAEVEWSVLEDLNVTTGLRYNDDELFGGHWTPRIYANYRFNPELTLKGGVSTGYKQPSLADATEGFALPTGRGSALIIGNEDLDPEKSTSYELGFVFNSLTRDFDASAMIFHTEFKDKIAEVRLCQGPESGFTTPGDRICEFPRNSGDVYYFISERQNIAEAEMQGVELTLNYGLTPSLALSSSYTYTESEQKTGKFKGDPLNKIPKHMANVGLDWQVSSLLSVWTDANVRGETSNFLGRDAMSEGTPGYGFVDLGMNYQLTDTARVKAGVYNIGDKEVTSESYGVVLDGRMFNVGLAVDF